MLKYLFALFFAVISVCPRVAAEQNKLKVMVYIYHLQAPLVTDLQRRSGLYFDFINLVNSQSDKYHFDINFMPRKRIDALLARNALDGILLGVNPVWFKDAKEQKFFWSSKFMTDRDEVVSLRSSSIEYNGPESLHGKILGGVRGFYYFGINEQVAQNKMSRVDTFAEADLFTMLLKGRVDAAIIGRSSFSYMVKKNHWQGLFYLSSTPHDMFERRVLVPKGLSTIYHHLEPLIKSVYATPTWQNQLLQYQ